MRYRKNNTSSPQKNPRKWVWIIVGLLVLAGLGVGALMWQKTGQEDKVTTDSGVRPRNTVDYSPATEDENKASDPLKNDTEKPGTLDDTPLENGTFSVTVTSAQAIDSSKSLRVTTLVEGVDGGTCTLTLTQTNQPNVTRNSAVASQGNSYACNTFNVPFSDLPAGGAWNVKVTLVKDNKQATGSWEGGAVNVTK